MERLDACRPARCGTATRFSYVRYFSTTSRHCRSTTCGPTSARASSTDEGLRRPDEHQGGRALHADVHRSRRPGARPDVRLRHDRLRRGAVGAAVDHDRHLPGRARAGPSAAHGARFPYYLLADSDGRAEEGVGAVGDAAAAGDADRRHPARVRVRAGAAHHAEVDRQQPGHRRGDEPGGDRRRHQAARRLRGALRQAVRGPVEGAGHRAVHGREPVAPPQPGVRAGRRSRPASAGGRPTRMRRRSSRPCSRTCEPPACRTAGGRSGSTFDVVESYAGTHIQAVGIREDGVGRLAQAGRARRSARSTERCRPAS